MAEERDEERWVVEEIPNDDYLYMGIHRNWLSDGAVQPGAFKNHGEGMSTDWSRYSTPEETRLRRRKPTENLVVQMKVGQVREIPRQSVVHTPLGENRAHTDVYGEKDPEARVMLRRIAAIVLHLSD